MEQHHILPASLGGLDVEENLIFLTPREHFIAHMMLAKVYGGPMITAIFMMSNMEKYGRVGSKVYEQAKVEFSARQSQKVGRANNRWGKAHSEETKSLMAQKAAGRKASEEARRKMREDRANRPPNINAIEALKRVAKENNPFKGKLHSESTRSKMTEKALSYKYTCPHCNKTGGRVMHRWHGDKCKERVI